ncbi:hypothetical protein [Actinomadura sediminis]|uniref:ANTAR domain-containing protein n=1 Tax=Actinomadura sediminis TaxID=1038904 RepID=A0ABW3EU49_9ACTN
MHLLARRVLDEADTIDAALEIVRGARVSASTVLTVVTYDGTRADARALEIGRALGDARHHRPRRRVRPDGRPPGRPVRSDARDLADLLNEPRRTR